MRGWFRSRALLWGAIFWILSALAAHQARHLWEQERQATRALHAARARLQSADLELDRLRRLVAAVPRTDDVTVPTHERVALLVQRLRSSEPVTRVTVQTMAVEGAPADKRAASLLMQPLPRLPGAGALGIAVDGTYVTRSGLEEFLRLGGTAGAAITTLSVQDLRFKAVFRIYGRT
jgi:hypothetical protein